MKLKYFEISNILSVLEKIAKDDIRSVKVKYRISRLLKDLYPHHSDFQTARDELIEKYAEKDEDGNYKKPTDDDGNEVDDKVLLSDVKAFNEDMVELANMEIDVALSGKIYVDDLETAEIDIPFDNITILQPVLIEPKGGD